MGPCIASSVLGAVIQESNCHVKCFQKRSLQACADEFSNRKTDPGYLRVSVSLYWGSLVGLGALTIRAHHFWSVLGPLIFGSPCLKQGIQVMGGCWLLSRSHICRTCESEFPA